MARIGKWLAGLMLGLVVLITIGLAGAFRTDTGRSMLVDAIVAAVEAQGWRLSIGRLAGDLPFELTADGLSVADTKGEFLRLGRAEIRLDPNALLAGRLVFETIALDDLRVIRAPQTGSAGNGQTPGRGTAIALPGIPISVRALSVMPLTLEAELAGERVALNVTSRTAVDPERGIDAGFAVTRLDGDGAIEGRLTSDAGLSRLTASIKGESAQGGWISRLLGLPGYPAIKVTLDGEGPVSGFEARYGISAGEDLNSQGLVRLSSLQPLALTIEGAGRAAAFIPAELRSALSGEFGYRLAVAMDRDAARVKISGLKLEAPEVTIAGGAEADLQAGTVMADVAGDLRQTAFLRQLAPGLDIGAGGIKLTASGPMSGPDLDVEFHALDVTLSGNRAARVEGRIRAKPVQGFGGAIDGTASLQGAGLILPDLPKGALGEELTADLSFQFADGAVTGSEIHLISGPAGLRGDASVNLESGTADLSALLTHDALGAAVAPLRSGRLEGTVHARYDGTHLGLQVGGSARGLGTGDADLDRVLAGETGFWIAARQISATLWELSSIEIGNPLGTISAKGTADQAALSGDITLTARIPDISRLDGSGTVKSGAVQLTALIKGGPEACDIKWDLSAADLSAMDLRGHSERIPRLVGGGMVYLEAPVVRGEATVTAETPIGPASVAAGFGWDGRKLAVSNLKLDRGGDRIRGAVSATTAPLAMDGVVDLVIVDLADWAKLGGIDLEGGISARLAASGTGGKQHLDWTAAATRVRMPGETPVSVDRIELTGALEDAFGGRALNSKTTIANASRGLVRADRMELAVRGEPDQLNFDLRMTGEAAGKTLLAESAGSVGIGDVLRVGVDRFELTGPERLVSLLAPGRATISENRIALEPVSIALFGGRIDVAGGVNGDQASGTLSVTNVSLPAIAAFSGRELSGGSFNASGEISGPLTEPSGRLDLELKDVSEFGGSNGELPPVSLATAVRLDRGALDGRAVLSGIGAVPFEARLVTRLPGKDPVVPVEVTMDWRGGLGELAAALPLDGNLIKGEAVVDLDFVGAFDARDGSVTPERTSGHINISAGRFENFVSGALLDPVTASVTLDGTRLVIQSVEAGDTTGGTAKISGDVELAEPTRPKVSLDLVMREMTVARRDDATVQLNADLAVRSKERRFLVSGEIVNQRTEIHLIGALPAGVEEIVVEEIRDGVTVTPAGEVRAPPAAAPPVDLDLKFSAPGRIFVRGRGLDSEWGGEIKIFGTAAVPRLLGEIAPIRGGFEFAGRRFDLGAGGVAFSGGEVIEPTLNLSATHKGADFTAIARITGNPSKPEFGLSSDPSYPEDEILAKILFGKFTARLTATEAIQLAQSTRTLLSGEPGTLDKIRGAIGVDVLTFAPGASDSELGRLKAGKYVRDDLFVGVEQGTTAGSTRSIVEWTLTPKVTVEGTVGSSSESTLGIQRRWEY